jgi:two-component system sensor histidine kinase PilS (NtrC family)
VTASPSGHVGSSEEASAERAPSPEPRAPRRTSDPGEIDAAAIRRRVQIAVGVRLLVGLVLLGAAYAVAQAASFTADGIFALLVVVFASSLAFAVCLVALPKQAQRLAYAVVGTDLVVTTGLVYLTGGAHSGFSFLFGVVVLGAALVVGPRPTLVAAGLAPILYVSVALGLANGWVALPPDQWTDVGVRTDADFSVAILRNLVGLLLVGGLAAMLSDRLHRTTGALVRATESAADSARLTEDIVRSLASGLVTTDLDGIVRTINVAGARMLGGAPDEIVGSRLDAMFPGVTTDLGARHETDARRRDGSTFPVGYSRTALVSHEGVVRGSLVLFQDLSELAALRDKAERAERLAVLGRLAAGLAHEIRNPLGAISGSVELVRDAEVLGAEDRGLLESVLGEVDRLNELVSTMLEVGRPTTPERRDVDLSELARDVVRLAARHPAASGVRIALTADAPVMVSVDAAQIRQVVWNLVKNALQFSPAGGEVRVVVSREGARACLSVSDRGPGIGAADLPHVFDMFFTKRRHGVGLGLALAKQVVDGHGGRIHVKNAKNGVTTFAVELDALPVVA